MSPTASETALAIVGLARDGRFDEVRDLFAPQLRSMVTPEALRASWIAALERHGPIIGIDEPISEMAGGGVSVVKVPVAFEAGAMTLIVSVTEAGQLAGIQLGSAQAAEPIDPWQPPPYADPAAFEEKEVTLGSAALAVSGTLCLPQGGGRYPGVVLLAGSGVLDRDETIGRNKPFKDLAWGLASRGVAVLRFDKVTFAHPAEIRSAAGFTVADEYIPHALAGIDLLRRHAGVDPGRIFVVGHSLGGTVAPRVVHQMRRVAGLAILAGGAEPLQWSIVRQVRYLASLDPGTAAASESTIEALAEQAKRVENPDLSESTPSGELPLGIAAPYWLDLRAHDPVAEAASLDCPIFLLQGGRDYQVTVDDDLERWKTGLAGRPNVTVRIYPADNHLFFPGSGPSTPAEYEPAQHVDPTVVSELAAWVAARSTPSGTAR